MAKLNSKKEEKLSIYEIFLVEFATYFNFWRESYKKISLKKSKLVLKSLIKVLYF